MDATIDICVSSEDWTEESFIALEKAIADSPGNISPWINTIFKPFATQDANLREYHSGWHTRNATNLVGAEQEQEDFCAVRSIFGRERDISFNAKSTKLTRRIMRLFLASSLNGRIMRDFVSAMKKVDVAAFESTAPAFILDKLSKIKCRDYSKLRVHSLRAVFELVPLHWNFVDRFLRARSVHSLCVIANQYDGWLRKNQIYNCFVSLPSFPDSVWWAIANIMMPVWTAVKELVEFCEGELRGEIIDVDMSYFIHLETMARRMGDANSKLLSEDKSVYHNFVSAIYRSRFDICYCARHLSSLRGLVVPKVVFPALSPVEIEFNRRVSDAICDVILPKIFLIQRLFYNMDTYIFIRYADNDHPCLICLNEIPEGERCRTACPRALYCKATAVCTQCTPVYFTPELTACPVCRAPIADPNKLL